MGPRSPAVLLLLLLGPIALAQEPAPVELGPPVRDAVTCFEFRVARLAKLEPLAGAWMRYAFSVPLPGGGAARIEAGLAGPRTTLAGLTTEWRKELGSAGWTDEGETAAGADRVLRFRHPKEGALRTVRLIRRHGRTWVLGTRFPAAEESAFAPIAEAVAASFKVTGVPADGVVPVLDGGGRRRLEELRLEIPVPGGVKEVPPAGTWVVLEYRCLVPNGGGCVIAVAASEPEETWEQFLGTALEAYKGMGYPLVEDRREPDARTGAAATLRFRKGEDSRAALFFKTPHAGVGLLFSYLTEEEAPWLEFIEEFARSSKIEGPAKKRSPRLVDVPLGDPVRDEELGIEIRIPKAAKKKDPQGWLKLVWLLELPDGNTGSLHVGRADEGEDLASFVTTVKMGEGGDGFEVVSERRDDWATGASLVLESRREKDRMGSLDFFYETAGRHVMVGFGFTLERTSQWRKITREVLASFRVTAVSDDRLAPPAGAEPSEEGDLVFHAPSKAIPPKALKALKDEVAAALALARDLTGGPAPERKIAVHVFPDSSRVRKVARTTEADAPAAVYVPEGRVVLVNAAPTAGGGRPLGSRCEAVLLAYLDAWLGTPRGLPPWVEAALREAARAAKVAGGKAVPDLKSSPLAPWIRGNARKDPWPPVESVLEAPRAKFGPSRQDFAAYALGIALGLRAASDEKLRTAIPRLLAELRRTRDPQAAQGAALEGIAAKALDAAARAALGKG
ncbi:MAG: hypothetical protein L0216_12240 [Planctomycetales bacterium]|nr:hypothetical protein [Planctomycetales bacterium]